MLSLATVTLSPRSFAISSSAGAIIRQGPHHSAQKSTRTGPSAPSTSVEKLWSVTVLVAMARDLLQSLTTIWAFGRGRSRREFDQLRPGGVEQNGADLPPWEDHSERFDIGLHLRPVRVRDGARALRHSAGLEVDHRYSLLFHEQSVDRAGDHAPVWKRRGKRRLAQRPLREERREAFVGKNPAHL